MVDIDKVRILYQQSAPVFVSTACCAILTWILWRYEQRSAPLVWLAMLTATALLRLVVFTAYHRSGASGREVIEWERPYFWTLLLSTSTWGLGAVLAAPKDSLLHQVIILAFLLGMSGGAFSYYSASRRCTLGVLVTMLLPSVLWYLTRWGKTEFWIGIATTVALASAFRATRVLSDTLHRSLLLTHELQQAKVEAEKRSQTDSLTNLYNHRAFHEEGGRLVRLAHREGSKIALILLDLDHFKQVNDHHGHAIGDEALRHTAQVIRASVRGTDLCARLGGEEFVVLLPATGLDAALEVAEKIRVELAAQPLSTEAAVIPITASLGVVSGPDELDDLLHAADEAMYRAKESGRNRVSQ